MGPAIRLGESENDPLHRVEGLGVGVEFDVGLLGPHTVATSGFFGLADLSPKVRVDLERSTVLRRLTLGAFHELRATDANAGHLAFGNSVTALFTGRDEGEYYKATGVDLTWRPPVGNRESFVFRAYAERHAAAETETDFAVFQAFDDSWRFRPNLEADETEEAGAELTLSSWWVKTWDGSRVVSICTGRPPQGAWWRAAESRRTVCQQNAGTVWTTAGPAPFCALSCRSRGVNGPLGGSVWKPGAGPPGAMPRRNARGSWGRPRRCGGTTHPS